MFSSGLTLVYQVNFSGAQIEAQCSEVDGTLQERMRPTVNLLLLILSSYYNALGSHVLLLTHVPR